MVDWETAVTLGSRIAGDGPDGRRRRTAEAVVAELRAGADRSTGLVREFTGLYAAERTAPVLVVDRPGWVRANAEAFSTIIEPLAARLTEKKGPPSGLSKAVGSKITGAEVGLLLGFLGGKVLGQFDPFAEPAGRLLLVAPNIVHVERELEADPRDFRLWVCLHEETHRVQFTAVPWMRDHMFAEIGKLVDTVKPDASADDRPADHRGVRGEGSLLDMMGSARAEGDRRPADRCHVAARGPRRRRDGRRRPDRHPVGRARSASASTSAARASASSTRCCAGCSGSTRRWRSTATAPLSSAPSSTRPGMDGFNAVWATPRPPAVQGRDPRPRRLGDPRARLSRWRCTPPSPPSGSPYAAAWPTLADRPGDRVRAARRGRRLLRRRRLDGPARRDRPRGTQGGLARRRGHRRPRPAGGLGRGRGRGVVAGWRRWAPTRPWRSG